MRAWFKKFLVAFVMVLSMGSVFFPSFNIAQAHIEGEFTAANHNHVVNTGATSVNPTTQQSSSGLWYSEPPAIPQLFLPGSVVTVGGNHPGNIPPQTSIVSLTQQTGAGTTTNQNTSNTPTVATATSFQAADSNLPICNILGDGPGSFEGCFVRLFYYIILYPTAWLARLSGQIFDYFIAFTLNSESYQSGGFVEKGWTIIRDLANASFIFILLYTAIKFIVNAKSADMARIVSRVILVAIVINFSLFMSRVIIDAGNILGRVFYEKITVENDSDSSINQYKTLSAGLLNTVNPQELLSRDMFKQTQNATSVDITTQSNTLGSFNNDTNNQNLAGYNVSAGFMIFIILVASVVNIAIVWVFISVSIFLIARTLGLWIVMIMSPVAFASLSIPFFKIPNYGFDDWLKKATSLSFMVVVFMFFLYLTIMFIEVSFDTFMSISGNASETSTVQKIMNVIVPLAAVLFLLFTAKKQAKSMAGEFADMVGKALKWGTVATLGAAGLALGAAAGATAVVGRQVGGRIGAKMAAGADTSTAMGRFKKRTGNYFANAKYDARSINIPKPAKSIIGAGKSGLSYATDGALSANDFNLKALNTFGKPSDKSYVQRKEDRVKKIVSEAKDFAPTDLTSVEILDSTGTKTIKTSISEAQKILDRKRIDIKQANDYDDKLKARDKQKKVLDEVKKDYDTSLREYSQGKINDIELASVKRALDAAKKSHDDKAKEIKDLEKLWSSEEKTLNDTKKALAKKKTEFFKNYSKTVDDWAAFPDAKATYRYDANKDAADEIENLGIKEEKKEEKKDDKK